MSEPRRAKCGRCKKCGGDLTQEVGVIGTPAPSQIPRCVKCNAVPEGWWKYDKPKPWPAITVEKG